MRIIAYYLPQFHNIPENDRWWGDGFTEWVNVKNAKPLFEGHNQPRVPLGENYYNLLDDDVKIWQARLAKEYGIYGFCYYHYWLGNGKMLLEKPMEQMLRNKEIDIPFCISWANHSWTKSWVGDRTEMLMKQEYGDENEWRQHFEYLLPFFQDERYIKENGKPFVVIYQPEVIPCLTEMLNLWNRWACEEGFPGISFAYQTATPDFVSESASEEFDFCIEYQPRQGRTRVTDQRFGSLKRIRRKVGRFIEKKTGINILSYGYSALQKMAQTNRIKYDDVWEAIISMNPLSDKSIPGAFSMWDNSPRYGENAEVYTGDSPEKFKRYMTRQIEHAKSAYKTDIMMFFAWNEWAEGGYLEPDEEDGYGYLEGIRDALKANGEWPVDYSADSTGEKA